jgi:hypothetical protein
MGQRPVWALAQDYLIGAGRALARERAYLSAQDSTVLPGQAEIHGMVRGKAPQTRHRGLAGIAPDPY